MFTLLWMLACTPHREAPDSFEQVCSHRIESDDVLPSATTAALRSGVIVYTDQPSGLEIELRDAEGHLLPGTHTEEEHRLRFTPDEPFEPDTDYEIVVHGSQREPGCEPFSKGFWTTEAGGLPDQLSPRAYGVEFDVGQVRDHLGERTADGSGLPLRLAIQALIEEEGQVVLRLARWDDDDSGWSLFWYVSDPAEQEDCLATRDLQVEWDQAGFAIELSEHPYNLGQGFELRSLSGRVGPEPDTLVGVGAVVQFDYRYWFDDHDPQAAERLCTDANALGGPACMACADGTLSCALLELFDGEMIPLEPESSLVPIGQSCTESHCGDEFPQCLHEAS